MMFIMLGREDANSPIFRGLTQRQFQKLLPLFDICQLDANQVIFEQGQRADLFYFLLEGEVVIDYKPYDGPFLTVARVLPGSAFGWSAITGSDVYSSRAISVGIGRGLCIRGCCLHRLVAVEPEIGKVLLHHLAEGISERLNSTYGEILRILTNGTNHSIGNCLDRKGNNGRTDSELHCRRTAPRAH